MKVLSIDRSTTGYKQTYTKVVFKNAKGREIEYEVNFDGCTKYGNIIRNGIDYAGIWFDEKNRLIDYDGVMILNMGAIRAIRKAGLTVPREYEDDLKPQGA